MKIVIVGEAYYADLRPDNSLPPWQGGQPSHPWVPPGNYPDQSLPGGQGGRPSHPIYHPGHPDHGLPAYPDQGLPGIPPGVPTHPWVPPSGETLPPPPEDIVNNYVVAVWNPTKEEWKVSIATGATPK